MCLPRLLPTASQWGLRCSRALGDTVAVLILLVLPGVVCAAAVVDSVVYRTVPGVTVEERGDRVPNGLRIVPVSATFGFQLNGDELSLTGVVHNAVLEGGDPFALSVRSQFWQQPTADAYRFLGDYLADLNPSGTQYLFDWTFTASTQGQLVWNGTSGWAGGHLWQVTISDVTLVPEPRLSIFPAGIGSVQITWPADFADYVLEYATRLPAANWTKVTGGTTTTGGQVSVTVKTGAASRFYRLRKG